MFLACVFLVGELSVFLACVLLVGESWVFLAFVFVVGESCVCVFVLLFSLGGRVVGVFSL